MNQGCGDLAWIAFFIQYTYNVTNRDYSILYILFTLGCQAIINNHSVNESWMWWSSLNWFLSKYKYQRFNLWLEKWRTLKERHHTITLIQHGGWSSFGKTRLTIGTGWTHFLHIKTQLLFSMGTGTFHYCSDLSLSLSLFVSNVMLLLYSHSSIEYLLQHNALLAFLWMSILFFSFSFFFFLVWNGVGEREDTCITPHLQQCQWTHKKHDDMWVLDLLKPLQTPQGITNCYLAWLKWKCLWLAVGRGQKIAIGAFTGVAQLVWAPRNRLEVWVRLSLELPRTWFHVPMRLLPPPMWGGDTMILKKETKAIGRQFCMYL